MHVQMFTHQRLRMQERTDTIEHGGESSRYRVAGADMSFSWGAEGAPDDDGGGFPVVRAAYDQGPIRHLEPVRPLHPRHPDRSTAGSAPGADLGLLAAELAPMVGVWQRLLAQHQPDRNGRCVSCTKGGTGLPSTSWPCSIHGIAELARRRHDSERP